MQDIDFDEIDRAVNSHNKPGVQTAAASARDPIAAFSEPVIDGMPQPEVVSTPETSPAVRRSSGRFMDVVHPSSDMRPSGMMPARQPAASASSLYREAVAERDEPITRPEPLPVASVAFHWPDPVDIAAPTSQPTPEMIETSIPEPAAELIEAPVAVPVTDELIDDDEEVFEDELAGSLESPFLTGTKVQKRPLGAFSGADEGLQLLEDPIPFSSTLAIVPEAVPEVVLTGIPDIEEPSHEVHEEVPQELHADLLALEGHSQDAVAAEPLLEASNPPDPVVAETIMAGPTSITQQYKEQPRSESQPSGSIFDTEAYHKALSHPVKKRSSALIIVWILALILVGGGIGAALYFVVLPMLG